LPIKKLLLLMLIPLTLPPPLVVVVVVVKQSRYRPEVPRGFQEVEVPDYVTTAQNGGKVSLTHLQEIFLVLISDRG